MSYKDQHHVDILSQVIGLLSFALQIALTTIQLYLIFVTQAFVENTPRHEFHRVLVRAFG